MTPIYRGMDRATLDAAYDNTAAVADSQAYRARWYETSAAVRARASVTARPALWRAAARHAGLFSRQPKADRCSCSFTVAIGNATRRSASLSLRSVRTPTASMSPSPDIRWRLTRGSPISSRRSIRRSHSSPAGGELGFDRNQLLIGGWSAGGHLTAAVAGHPAVAGGSQSAAYSISNQSRSGCLTTSYNSVPKKL